MSRLNRSNFYPKVIIDGITLNDFQNNFYDRFFEIKRPLSYYTIQQQDIQRPDMISYKVYGDLNYWWILMKYNNIFDVWNDLVVGEVLNVPSKLDIDDFIIASSKANQ
jgi:hypothetical protein